MSIHYIRMFFLAGYSTCQLSAMGQNAAPREYSIPVPPFFQQNDATLNNDVPRIIIRDKPSVLVWVNGDPVITIDTSLRMYRILNTPNLIIKNHNDNKYYLYSDQGWYVSDSATKGYAYRKTLPPVIRLMDSLVKKGSPRTIKRTVNPAPPPQVIISTGPASLLYTQGKPVWKNIEGTSLLYVQNTADDILRDTLTNTSYVLLSGRWYSSGSGLEGPWTYTASNQLPADFVKIPPTSAKADVRIHISGTEEALQAVTRAQEFKTIRIPRKTDSTISVRFDGGAEFASLSASELFIAQNSDLPVFSYRDVYYLLKNGAWYRSIYLNGPWEVSTVTPPDIEKLPSSNAFYYAKYVHIADTTSTYVETGYTAGYLHNYIQNNTVVYGTGVIYNQWQRNQFFVRPLTWFQGVNYKGEKGWFVQSLLRYYGCTLP